VCRAEYVRGVDLPSLPAETLRAIAVLHKARQQGADVASASGASAGPSSSTGSLDPAGRRAISVNPTAAPAAAPPQQPPAQPLAQPLAQPAMPQGESVQGSLGTGTSPRLPGPSLGLGRLDYALAPAPAPEDAEQQQRARPPLPPAARTRRTSARRRRCRRACSAYPCRSRRARRWICRQWVRPRRPRRPRRRSRGNCICRRRSSRSSRRRNSRRRRRRSRRWGSSDRRRRRRA
jgi:hypothetical protein